MSNEFSSLRMENAVDALEDIRRSVDDLTGLRRLVRRAKKTGKEVDVEKVRGTLFACIDNLMESCHYLSQGPAGQRIALSGQLADRIIKEDTK